ncbi:MAG TPA: sulfurtransferase [Thermoanaerobaculia bacterium]|nr:sulfurtransferase [Thermoanaerobaculia bacterium]
MKPAFSCLFLALLVNVANAAVNERMLVSTEWLAAHLRDRNLTIIHVGATPEVYASGHVPGAVFLALTDLVATRGGTPNEVPQLDKLTKTLDSLGIGNRGRVIVYGDEPIFAARFFYTLDYLGHGQRVALLDGGLGLWKKQGHTIETTSRTVAAEPFTARVHPEDLVYLSQLKKIAPSDSLALIDARPSAQFSGKEAGDGVERPGHIPGAMNVFWKDALDADEKLLSVAELRKLHERVDRAKPVVTYCRTGMQSSFEYYVLRYLGYNVALYDGSFLEWSNEAGTNVE